MKTHRAITPEQARRLADMVVGLPIPFTLTWSEGKMKRTIQQNALLHMWFGEIAKWHGDCTADEVKGWCHHKWGLDIRKRDPQFLYVWTKATERMDYEQQCRLLSSGIMSISSEMGAPELSEYMNAMALHYRAEGVRLTDPEMLKHEEESK